MPEIRTECDPHFHGGARLTMLFLEIIDKAHRNVCLIENLLKVVSGFILFASAHKNPNYQIQTYFWDRQFLTLIVEISAQPEFFLAKSEPNFEGTFPPFSRKLFKLLVPILGTKFGPQNWNPKFAFC